MERWLALELASTIRHDGAGGVADDLATVEGLADWLGEQSGRLPGGLPAGLPIDERLRQEVTGLRRAVRALFARAVSPAPPSAADAGRLMPAAEAVAALNAAAALEPVVPQLSWPPGEPPTAALLPAADAGAEPEPEPGPESAPEREPEPEPDPGSGARAGLLAALARAAIEFLAGPQREQLRSCSAPRCVRYFLRSHGRQAWCKPSCGNRARVARHAERRRTTDPDSR
ncbi:CGNR zinc finger domain-containing protein [Streptomyces sp. NPDC002054]|uniref:CGNR zinc finger domain-containing protein n=1 Tax=Streptomyces sp. NPDC002054 TaxID=3154663 RepID=UPI0033312B2E